MMRMIDDRGVHMRIIRPSAAMLLMRLFAVILLLDTAYVLAMAAVLFISVGVGFDQLPLLMLWGLYILKFFLSVVLLLPLFMRSLGTTIVMTKDHLCIDKGMVQEEERIYELAQLQAIKLRQGWLGKRLNFGDIILTLGSRSYTEIVELLGVSEPHEHVAHISRYLKPV
ncbi:MAG: PH domain-containing protein [Candidatus Saccharimonadales bacterium]